MIYVQRVMPPLLWGYMLYRNACKGCHLLAGNILRL